MSFTTDQNLNQDAAITHSDLTKDTSADDGFPIQTFNKVSFGYDDAEDTELSEDAEDTELSDDAEDTSEDDGFRPNQALNALLTRYYGNSPSRTELDIFEVYADDVVSAAVGMLIEARSQKSRLNIVHIILTEHTNLPYGITLAYIQPKYPSNIVNVSAANCRRPPYSTQQAQGSYSRKTGALIATCALCCGLTIPIYLERKGYYSTQLREMFYRMYNIY